MSEANQPPNSERQPGEAIESTVETPQALTVAVPQQTAGQVLRQAREDAGVTVAHLAAGLKVSAKTITALEENNVAALPDLAFSRALTSSICRTLKIPAAPILALMPSLPQAHVVTNQEVGLNLPMASPFKLNISLAWFKTSAFAIIAVLALATLAVANWPTVITWVDQLQKMATTSNSAANAERTVTAASNASLEGAGTGTTVNSSTAPASEAQSSAGSVPNVAATSAASTVALGAVASASAAGASPSTPAAVSPVVAGPLVFRATASR